MKFAANEKLVVNIDMDNSKCKKPVKSFKVKLLRTLSCFSGKKGTKPVFEIEDYIHSLKYDGCAEKVRENRTIEFQLPA